jgi:aminoglycoside phosphotransferase family enzyme
MAKMNYSQQSLIKLFKSGEFPGEVGIPKHIETVISNVFIFDKKVYKFYKNDNEFFNKGFRNLAPKNGRFDFTKRDFKWNNSLSPTIYLEAVGVKVKNEKIVIVKNEEDAEEIVIVMNRVNTDDLLFEKLMRGEISEDESFLMGKQLAESLKNAQKKLDGNHNFYEKFEMRVSDLRDWIKSVSEFISEEESKEYCDFLEVFRKDNREWFEKGLSEELVHGGDMHSHNAVFTDGTLYLMDTFPPKEEWIVDHRLIPLYRVGADIWALSGNRNLFESFVKGYEAGSGTKVNRLLDDLYIIYASAIMVSYLYMLQRTDKEKRESAERFHKFIREYFSDKKLKVS